MSIVRPVLKLVLRLVEKPSLRRATRPEKLRRSLEIKSWLLLHPPRGTSHERARLAGVPVELLAAPGAARDSNGLILYFHGGGYILGSPRTHRTLLARLSSFCHLPACLPDYRLAPEHPFPAAFDDALAVYREVMDTPGGVILGGDSSGGGLALALLGEIIRQDLPKPRALFAFSPFTDLTLSGRSLRENATTDPLLPASRAQELVGMYLGPAAPDDPRASPLFADFKGAPPVWLTVSDTEILRDDTTRMADRLRGQGVDVTEIITHDLPHVWPIFDRYLPEAQETLRDLGRWISHAPPLTGDS